MKVSVPEWAAWLDVPRNELLEPVRHRVLFGGRGGAKSWSIVLKLIERARLGRKRILCLREFQNSMRDSSKKLIENCIERMGMGPAGDRFFSITEHEIRGSNGSVFTFVGLNGKDASIKSFEGYDLAWVEEAATLSQSSIDALIPTIRREGSEIWWSYNPRYPTDPVDRMFRGGSVPPGTVLVEVGHDDNPWFPDVLRRDMEYDRDRDPEKYAHIWQGQYVTHSEAQVFRNWQVNPFEAPSDAVFRFGADWGYSKDPTVLIRCFIGRWAGEPGRSRVIADPTGRCLFVDYEAYMVGCPVDDIPALFAGPDDRQPPRWTNQFAHPGIPGARKVRITADSARPETIDHVKARGFDIVGATKGSGSVEDGIEFLKNYDIVVHPRCKHLADELVMYRWVIDRQTGLILPKLADTNNHVIDALRYALEGVRKASAGEPRIYSSGPRLGSVPRFGFMGPNALGEPQVDMSSGWGSVPSHRSGI